MAGPAWPYPMTVIVLDLVFPSVTISKQKHLRYRLIASSDIAAQRILLLTGSVHFGLKLHLQEKQMIVRFSREK